MKVSPFSPASGAESNKGFPAPQYQSFTVTPDSLRFVPIQWFLKQPRFALGLQLSK
jgi:hypothetical protein